MKRFGYQDRRVLRSEPPLSTADLLWTRLRGQVVSGCTMLLLVVGMAGCGASNTTVAGEEARAPLTGYAVRGLAPVREVIDADTDVVEFMAGCETDPEVASVDYRGDEIGVTIVGFETSDDECASTVRLELAEPAGDRLFVNDHTGTRIDVFPPEGSGPPPPPPPAEPVLMEIVPSSADPGARLELLFPARTGRGGYFELQRWLGSEWSATEFFLGSDVVGSGPQIFTAGENPCGPGCDALGFGGPGPDLVDIPDRIEPGTWRICALTKPELCGRLVVGGS